MVSSDDSAAERVLTSRRLYEGRIVALREDEVELPDGRHAFREVVEHADVVAVLPVAADGRLLLVRQYRLPAGRALLELPAGGVDPGEGIGQAAQRELQEETGHRARSLERLGGFYVSPGYCTEFIHLFLARDLTPSVLEADHDEQITVELVTLDEALRLVDAGGICDSKSIIGLLLAARDLGLR